MVFYFNQLPIKTDSARMFGERMLASDSCSSNFSIWLESERVFLCSLRRCFYGDLGLCVANSLAMGPEFDLLWARPKMQIVLKCVKSTTINDAQNRSLEISPQFHHRTLFRVKQN